METNDSIFQDSSIDSSGQTQLISTGKWAKFIGIVYLVLAALLFIMGILLFTNLEIIASQIMEVSGMSQEALAFMMGAGKWLFILMIILSSAILAFNGYFLVKFGKSSKQYSLTFSENQLADSFAHLSKYMMLTTVLSILSILFSIIAIGYYFYL